MTEETAGERNVWLSANRLVESTIPADLVSALDLQAGDDVEIRPLLDGTNIAFHVLTEQVDPDRSNARKVKQRTEPFDQSTLRFPSALSAVSGLGDLVTDGDTKLEYESVDDGFMVLTWPPLRPWMPDPERATFGEEDAVAKNLHHLPGKYVLFIPTEFATALGLEKGQHVAWRLSMADGSLALIADLDVPDDELDGRHVRKVQASEAGAEDRLITQFHVYVPFAVVHALAWEDTRLRLDVGEGLVRLTPGGDDQDRHEVDAEVVEAVESGASTPN